MVLNITVLTFSFLLLVVVNALKVLYFRILQYNMIKRETAAKLGMMQETIVLNRAAPIRLFTGQ